MAQPVQSPQGPPQPGRPQLRSVVIGELVETDVVTAERETSVQEIVADMAQEDVGSVVIVDDERPVGILTDRTIALALESTTDLSDYRAEDFLTDSIVTGTAEMSVFEAIRRLEEEEVRRLPIVDDEGQLTGIVTLDDILVLLSTEIGSLTSVVKAQSPRL
jgi:CBS domain-containing protein